MTVRSATAGLQAKTHFIAKRLLTHENDAFQAIFADQRTTFARRPLSEDAAIAHGQAIISGSFFETPYSVL
jgi:hypothetical protein